MKNEQSPTKEIWESLKYLLGLVFWGFLYCFGSLALVYIFLDWLGINIIIDNGHRFVLLVWGGWIIGFHLYFKHKDEKRLQEQLELLRQGESVTFPHPKLIEEREKEQEANERAEAKERIGRILTDTEWEEVKIFRMKQREVLKKEREERAPITIVLEEFKWMKKRQTKDEKEYDEFLKRYKDEEVEVLVQLPSETYEPQQKKPRKLAFMISADHTAEEAFEAFQKFQQTGKPVISLKKNNQPSQDNEEEFEVQVKLPQELYEPEEKQQRPRAFIITTGAGKNE